EVDRRGKVVWQCFVDHALCMTPLPDGNLLVGSSRPVDRVVEQSRDGRILWEVFPRSKPGFVRVCANLVRLGFDRPRDRSFDLDSLASIKHSLRREQDLARRRKASAWLRQHAEIARTTIPELTDALDDPDPGVRQDSRDTLGTIGRPAYAPLLA